MASDERQCYQRVRKAARALCCRGKMSERLNSASMILAPLLLTDFPTGELRQRFVQVRQKLAEAINEEQQDIAAISVLDLYRAVCRLDLQEDRE